MHEYYLLGLGRSNYSQHMHGAYVLLLAASPESLLASHNIYLLMYMQMSSDVRRPPPQIKTTVGLNRKVQLS